MNYYAIIQNGYSVFGHGPTIAACVADANLNLDDPVTFETHGSDTLIDRTNGRSYTVDIGELYITDLEYRSDIEAHGLNLDFLDHAHFTESMHIQTGRVDGAWIIDSVIQLNAYATLCLICAELDIDLSNVTDSDFDSAALVIESFCKHLDASETVSIWWE